MNGVQGPCFGRERDAIAWQRKCNALAATMTSEFAVAPDCFVTRADGRVLRAGEAITVADFEPLVTPAETINPRAQLDRAVRIGAVLVRGRRYPIQDGGGPAAA